MTDQTLTTEQTEAIENAIALVLNLGLSAELCGSWVWVDPSEATRQHKDTLKTAGFRWAPKKMQWYYPGSQSRGARGGTSMEAIRSKYGSDEIN